jgi:peptidyl-prolyl cis-trans isomerase D
MLSILRRHSQSWVVKTLLGALALSFVVGFGLLTGGTGGGGGAVDGAIAARIDGVPITNLEVAREEQRLYDIYKQRLGDQLTDDIVKQLNLRFQAMNRLVNRVVLQKEAERLGFVVSDEELRELIGSIEAFQGAEGAFDPAQYEYVLAQQRPRLTPKTFEQQQREALLIAKLERFVRDLVHVTDDEVLGDWLVENVTIDVDVLRFDPAKFESQVRISDDEIAAYYAENKDTYQAPKKAQLRTVRFPITRWAPKIEIGEAELKAAYDADPSRFKLEEQATARHLLIKIPVDAPEDEQAAVRARLETIKAEVGNDVAKFAAAARANGEDSTSEKGGELGSFGRGRMVKEFEEAVFGGPTGEAIGPVRTPFGYHLIFVEDRSDAGTRPLEAVADELRKELQEKQALATARAEAERIRAALAEGRDFKVAVQGLDLDFDTDWVEQGSPAAQLKYPPEVLRDVFVEETEFPRGGRVVEFSGRPFLVEVLDRQGATPRPMAEVRDEIRNKLRSDRATTLAAENALAALEDLQAGQSVAQIARRYGVPAAATGPFNARTEELPLLGKQPEIRAAAFRLTEESPVPPSTYRIEGSYVVLHLRDRVEPDPAEFNAQKAELRAAAIERKSDAAWLDWLRSARSRFPVEWDNPPAELAPEQQPLPPQG